MTVIDHAIAAPPPGRLQRRLVGLLFAGLLQVAMVYALIVGLKVNVWPAPVPPLQGEVVIDHIKPLPPAPSVNVQPTQVTAVKPTVDWTENSGGGETAITVGPAAGTGPVGVPAQGIMSTHTKPPYPPLAIILGEQGVVVLRLTITTQGTVQAAAVVTSSGFPKLDEAAQAWVIRQWRYRPASIGGQPVASTADVAIKFDLQHAG